MDIEVVRTFYWKEFIVIYDILNANLKQLPSELHFEIAAAFDHLMRAQSTEIDSVPCQENLEKALGHLKRATFDGFKLLFKYPIRNRWLQLTHPRYAEVDNGNFIPRVENLWGEAKETALRARRLERLSRKDDPAAWGAAFGEWKKLLPILTKLDKMADSEVARRARRKAARSVLAGGGIFVLGFLANKGLDWFWSLLRGIF